MSARKVSSVGKPSIAHGRKPESNMIPSGRMYFSGCTVATATGTSMRTLHVWWMVAFGWLRSCGKGGRRGKKGCGLPWRN